MIAMPDIDSAKRALRTELRRERRDFVDRLPPSVSALVFSRPPGPVAERLVAARCVGLYAAAGAEAPTAGYARFLADHGVTMALPWFSARDAAMTFRAWSDEPEALAPGPFGIAQPDPDAELREPDLLLVPLVGFDAERWRLGQGGGHYDRYLARAATAFTIGLGWSVQQVERVPRGDHDQRLDMVVTESRLFAAVSPGAAP